MYYLHVTELCALESQLDAGVSVLMHSGFLTNAKIYVDIIANFVIYLQFPSVFASYDVGKCEIRYEWDNKDCISRLQISLVNLISYGTAKTKLAILAFLCCGESVKTPNVLDNVN